MRPLECRLSLFAFNFRHIGVPRQLRSIVQDPQAPTHPIVFSWDHIKNQGRIHPIRYAQERPKCGTFGSGR